MRGGRGGGWGRVWDGMNEGGKRWWMGKGKVVFELNTRFFPNIPS